ncbi:histidine phosphatase family protein [Stackebrandtia nassauensis]|uniref:Phosphoglycerate mutase n=1 Tax=Stackebrandtia nassauensis (strain DSM 44728 / CIP 108903 / NRRL B-16338 / NBRC 102104 / LLR-40K-21) TaxID=446470 RepID=D3QBJ5_STANL|nr:histidine phosphatase family protein [Stackebrandtia nassauensis]ADD42877.1 Phosphoglycerate mutase [Stackebrandtia nassauensis DSM 44728]
MTRIQLVRHAMPIVDARQPPWCWRLDAAAVAEAEALADRLDAGGRVVSSTETKAIDTARAITRRLGGDVVVDGDFGEVTRPAAFDPRHRDLAAAYLAGADHPGWEPREVVVARFDAAIARHRDASTLVVVTHGMALSLWVAHVRGGDVVASWRGLGFPDVVTVDVG